MPQAEPLADQPVTRAFLVDDHAGVREAVRSLLELSSDIAVVGEDGSAVTAAAAILALSPDVAIVDLRLGDGSGIEVCRDVSTANADIATLVLTADDDNQAAVASILAGSRGYVLKLGRGTGLMDSVRRVAAGGDVLDPDRRASAMHWLMQEETRLLTRLSATQARVLTLVRDGLLDNEIATEMQVPVQNVRGCVSILLAELGYPSRAAAGRPTGGPAAGDTSARLATSWP